jgi:hypothetical protein
MLETHIKMSSLIFHLAFLLILLLVLCPIFLMDLNIAHMILVHDRVALCIVALVLTHVLIVVLVPRVGTVLPQEVLILTLSRAALTVHTFPVVVHITLSNCEMHKTVVTSSSRVVNCWISKIFFSLTPT